MLGLEMMIEGMLKSMGITPAQIAQYGGELKGFAQGMAKDMTIIRRDQLRIMEKLGIPIQEQTSNGENNRAIGNGISIDSGNDS